MLHDTAPARLPAYSFCVWIFARRICHVPRRRLQEPLGPAAAAFGKAVPFPPAPWLVRLTNAAGIPLKSVGGRSWGCVSPALSSRPECLSGSKVCVDRSDSLSHHLLEAIVLAAHLMSLITRVSYLQYRIFSCHGSVKGEENVSFTYHIF